MANIIDVAKEADVSVATVSYVISKKKFVSQELSQKVWAAIEKLGYQKNALASGLRTKQTNEIGIILQNLRNIWFSNVLSGIEHKASELGYNLTFIDTNYDFESEKAAINTFLNRMVDGIFLYSCVDEKDKQKYTQYLENIALQKKVPIVSMDRKFPSKSIGYVTTDSIKGTYDATEHLISSGRRNLLYITGRLDWDLSIIRKETFIKIMDNHGLKDRKIIREGRYRAINGYEICKELLAQKKLFDGVITANDPMAIGCIKALNEAKVRIPEDVAVVGYDNLFISSIVSPALSTINVQRFLMGYSAVEILIEMIQGKAARDLVIENKLIIRESSCANGDKEWDINGW